MLMLLTNIPLDGSALQIIVALGAGPWDQLFHQGNIPAFALASAFAFISAVLGLFMLPKLSGSSLKQTAGGMH